MFIGSDEDILGLPEDEKKISTTVEHSFNFDIKNHKEGTNFAFSDVKEKKKMTIVEKTKNKKKNVDKRGKSSNLF